MKSTITLTKIGSAPIELRKEDVRVIENIAGGGSLVTLQDGAQFHIAEDVADVLDLLNSRSAR